MNSIDQLKMEITELKNKLANNSDRLSADEMQIISDTIADKKREIEKLSFSEHKEVPVAAPIVGDKRSRRPAPSNSLFSI